MLSRALSLATVMLLIGFAAVPAQAQNLEAGKSPSQIFAGGCAVCHKSPRGLLKTVAPGALPGFLRQHYTTSTDMASALSAYVISNGAADTRFGGGGLTRQGKELTSEQKPAAAPAAAPAPAEERGGLFGFGRKPEPAPQEAAKPEEPAMTARQKRAAERAAKRLARPAAEHPDSAKPVADGQPPATAEGEARPAQKQKLGKKNRRDREEPPKTDAVKDEPKTEPKAEPKAEPVRAEPARPVEEHKPEVKPETESKPETPPLRADPVPAVTPAPKPSEPEARPAPVETPAPVAPAPAPVPSPAPAPAPAAPAPAGASAPPVSQ